MDAVSEFCHQYAQQGQGVRAHTFNPSTRKAEAGQPGLHSKLQDNQDHIKTLSQTNKKGLQTTARESSL